MACKSKKSSKSKKKKRVTPMGMVAGVATAAVGVQALGVIGRYT